MAVLSAVTQVVDKLWTKQTQGIGVGIAGLVEPKKGVFLGGPNLPLGMKNLKLAAFLKTLNLNN
jgi:predicted NBD/HSP70 family sugar kinase